MTLLRRRALALLAALLLAPALRAEEADEEPVFISMTRTAEPIDRLPSNVSVLTAAEIRETGARTLDEALEHMPSVDVLRTGALGSFATLRLRGAPSSAHVQLVVDDVPAGGASIQFIDLSQFPVGDIERIEVVRGGSSALYGANTTGGVVHVITKRHRASEDLSSVGVELGSFQTSLYRADLGVKRGRFDARVDGGRYFTDGYQANGDARNVSVSGNAGYSFGSGARLGADVRHSNHETGDPQGTTLPPALWDGTRERTPASPVDRAEQDVTAGRLLAAAPLGAWAHAQTVFFVSDQDYRTRGNSPTDTTHRILGNDTRFLLPGGLTLGASYERNERDSLDASLPAEFRAHAAIWGVYLQESLALGNLDLLPAVRFDQHSVFGNVVNPRFTAVYRFSETWKISTNAARSFRAPTLVQLYQDFPAFNFFSNPQLRPETAWTYDLGVQYGAGAFKAGVTGYHTRLRDRIAGTSNFPAADTNVNAPRAELSGVETEISGAFGPFTQRLSHAYQRAVGNSATGGYVPLRLTPRHLADLQIVWKLPDGWRLANGLRYVHKQFQLDNEAGIELPGYALWNARLTKTILAAELHLAVDNATNRRYADGFGAAPAPSFATTYLVQPGRTISAGLTIRFRD